MKYSILGSLFILSAVVNAFPAPAVTTVYVTHHTTVRVTRTAATTAVTAVTNLVSENEDSNGDGVPAVNAAADTQAAVTTAAGLVEENDDASGDGVPAVGAGAANTAATANAAATTAATTNAAATTAAGLVEENDDASGDGVPAVVGAGAAAATTGPTAAAATTTADVVGEGTDASGDGIPQSTASSSPDLDSGDTFSGDGTYYTPDLGACGQTNTEDEYVVAISSQLYKTKTVGGNPNNNGFCGKKIKASYEGKSVEVTVVDACVGCSENDLDFSPAAFEQIADKDLGRIKITWQWA